MWTAFIIVILKNICYNEGMLQKDYLNLIKNDYAEKFEKFSRLLSEGNSVCNLTSVIDEKGVTYKHFYDSVAGESFIPQGATVIEIGSGGGFPSIPLKILRDDLSFTLIESTGKKCRYLQGVVDNLSLKGVQVKNVRAEEGAHSEFLREKFDCAVARAVARLNTLCEYCLPYVKLGGRFLAYKGDASEELEEAKRAIKILGGEIEEVYAYALPEDYGRRTIIAIRKVIGTPPQYPRGQGKERNRPL